MQRYAIIDTKAFDCQCLLLEHQGEHLVILENRQYLPPVTNTSWQAKLPQILRHISKNLPDTEFVFLLPDSAVIHLTVEVPRRPKTPIRENISRILYRDFKISPQKYCFQFSHLDRNRYVVSLVTRKFINFVKETIQSNLKQAKILPFFAGQFAYIKGQKSDQNTVTIFIEKNLRRFFVKTPQEINFIDFYQPKNNSSDEFGTVRNTQQFIFQTLNIPEGKKQLFLIGDISESLKEIYATEYGTIPTSLNHAERVLGCTAKISEIAKCTYLGIDSIINGENFHLNVFDFQKLSTDNYHKTLLKHQKKLVIAACFCLFFSGFFFANEIQQHIRLKGKDVQLHHHLSTIERLQAINNYLLEKEQQSTLLPQILLKYCYLLQTLPGSFCIDHLSFERSDNQDFCSIRGRIHRENLEIFKKTLNERLQHKLDFYSEPSDETIDNFSIRIPLDPLPVLS